LPFELPVGWMWCRLGDLCDYGTCNNVAPSEIPNNAWVLDLEDIEKDTAKLLQRVKKINRNTTSTRHSFSKGDVLYSKLRTYLNKVLVADTDGFCTTEILPLDFKGFVVPEYARHVLMSKMFLDYTAQCGYGVKMPRLGTGDGKKALFPLPPLAEQKRIVSEIQCLFSFIDAIKENKLSLDQLIKQTKSKVLDFAIRGKLIPQNPNDDPATLLLERIKDEQEKKKEASDISYYPFEIPKSWVWATISHISESVSAGGDKPEIFSPIKTNECSVPIYSNGIANHGLYGYTNVPTITSPSITISARGTIGYSCIRYEPFCPIVRLISVIPNTKIISIEYLYRALCFLIPQGEGSSIPQLTVPTLKPKEIPLPPLDEQKRIVSKIEEIFVRLDEIGKELKA